MMPSLIAVTLSIREHPHFADASELIGINILARLAKYATNVNRRLAKSK
jgi:hypothetical protein